MIDRILALLVLALALTACGSVDVGLPDPTQTAQLAVAYSPELQTVVLTEEVCPDDNLPDLEAQVLQGYQGVNMRVYYGLKPATYCLTWGDSFASGWLVRGNVTLTLSAGMAEFISVVPQIATSPDPG